MNRNPFLALALALITMLSSAVMPAAEGSADGDSAFYGAAVAMQNALVSDYTATVYSNGTCRITKYKGSSEEITVPSSINGALVTTIGEFAFAECHSLKKVTIPETVISVERGAFNFCDSLLSIEVEKGNGYLASIDGVLYSKDLSELVAFPGGKGGAFTVPKTVNIVCDYAFDHCYKLTSINMYNSVTEISDHAFSFCWGLSSLRLSDRLYFLGDEAFSYCEGLKEYHLPASLDDIGEDAFLGTISSNGDKQYYFINGIYCVPGTYSYDYVKNLGVTVSSEVRTITDIDSGLVVIDPTNSLPYTVDISVTMPDTSENIYGFKKYDSYTLYDVSLVNNGKVYTPKETLTLSFDGAKPDIPDISVKLYSCTQNDARLIYRSPLTEEIEADFPKSARFAVLGSTDYSLKGDCDGDGYVTTFDALSALCGAIAALELTEEQIAACDMDGDGVVSAAEALTVLRMAVGIEE